MATCDRTTAIWRQELPPRHRDLESRTNRVIEECVRDSSEPPTFQEQTGNLVVALRAVIGPTPQVGPQVTPQLSAIVRAAEEPSSLQRLQNTAGLNDREHFRTGR